MAFSMENNRIAVVSAARTAIGKFGGSLKDISAIQLGTIAAKEAIRRADLEPKDIERVIAGENMQVSPRGNPARPVLLNAGIPFSSDDYSINMNCVSSLRGITCLAQDLLFGDVSIGLVVGMENMSQTPYLLEGLRWGTKLGTTQAIDFLSDYILGDAGPMAEKVAELFQVSRQDQDCFAYESQMKAVAAVDGGKFKADIVPVELPQRKGNPIYFEVDEHIRRDSSLERLGKLPPAFKPGGTVTAGNSSGINDGAAAVVLMLESHAMELGLKPRAFLKGWASAGVDPSLFGIGPVPATQKVLKRLGMRPADLKLAEINEAFASSTIAAIRELDLDPGIVNVNGGAIAHGHPVGATGIILLMKLIGEMERRDVDCGMVSMCVGNGQGMSIIIER
jgi:acetyl-CoA C-acetyltransferase